jgi:hypothetical protein
VDHRLTQLLGSGVPVASSDRDLVGRSIVLDHRRMFHGYVGRPLREVPFDGIAAVVHHSLHELMGVANGTLRLVHEVALSRCPLLEIAFPGGGIERPDLELTDALTAVGQLLLGGSLVAALRHDAAVLRSKLILQSPRPLLPCNENSDDRQQHDDNPAAPRSWVHSPFGPLRDRRRSTVAWLGLTPDRHEATDSASEPRRMHTDVALGQFGLEQMH